MTILIAHATLKVCAHIPYYNVRVNPPIEKACAHTAAMPDDVRVHFRANPLVEHLPGLLG